MTYRIEICAGLGCGKTTLATALKAHGLTAVHEEFEDNPHLSAFYTNPGPDTAYRKDLWFIHAQHKQLLALKRQKGPFIVDYSVVLSQAYIQAGLNTPENKEKLLEKWDAAVKDAGWPDLVIVLDLSVSDQIERIQNRGRESEKDLPSEFLENLNDAIQRRLKNIPEKTKILRLDARRDFTDDAEILKIHKEILAVINTGRGPKNTYLNLK